ncbi:MAG: hypothetical protein IJL50_00985 [Bacteroidaceae bacterium]|nr:hypothetical protein [Bacteroidaceae bacterium]
MKKFFNKSFWTGFVAGIFFVIITIIALVFYNYSTGTYDCTWDDPRNVKLRIDQMNQCIECAELKIYTDSTYNVHVFYPSCFKVVKEEVGKARFQASFHEGRLDYCLKVDSINEGTNYYYNNEYYLSNDSIIKCHARGNDYIVISGPYFIKKLFMVNNLYVEYKFNYSMSHEAKVSERLINIVKEWNPRIE